MSWSKRALDVIGAGAGLIVLSPLLLALAVWVKLDSPGPVLYRGTRVGKDGRTFRILKFRTMVADAAQKGGGITTRNDPRVTHSGAVLRRFKLDELPQLWNVLRGEMSLVGPRPEDPRYIQYYTPAQRRVLVVPPGVTGAASLAFRHEEEWLGGADWEQQYIGQVLPRKLELELAYLERRTFWSDVSLLGRTFLAMWDRGGQTS